MNQEAWVEEQIYFSGDRYFDSVIAETEKAQSSIDVECYIFNFDQIGQALINSLIKAAKRGVRVRILVDGFGSAFSIPSLQRKLLNSPIEFKVFHPLFGVWYVPIFLTLNRRNHRKVWIFDQAVALTGSFNVSDVHTTHFDQPWRDMGIRVQGQQVQILFQSFEKVWEKKILGADKISKF